MKIDALMLQNKGQKSTFSLDIQLGRNVICGQSVLNHENNAKENCDCYFCKKHWSKIGGRPSFKPRRFVWLLNAAEFNNSKFLGEIVFVSSYEPVTVIRWMVSRFLLNVSRQELRLHLTNHVASNYISFILDWKNFAAKIKKNNPWTMRRQG